jgi:hypothetical protein
MGSAEIGRVRPARSGLEVAAMPLDDELDRLGYVDASLNYLVPMADKPVAYNYPPPDGTPWRNAEYRAEPVRIRDARPLIGELSLDKQGFALTRHVSQLADFYDPAQVKAVYYPEMERLVQAVTGARRVVCFDHIVRHAPRAESRVNGVKEPAKRVHNDYTEASGPQRVRDLLPDEAEELLKRRFAVVNVWRAIHGPLQDSPLALCDARSIAPTDLVDTDLKYPDRTGEIQSVTRSPAHRWYYFPNLLPSEALFIKCFDSAKDGRARFAAHGAFADPTTPADARPRESIEARTLVFF